VVRIYGHILLDLDLVDGLEDGQPVADTVQADLFEFGMLQRYQSIARYALVCTFPLAHVLCRNAMPRTSESASILVQAQTRDEAGGLVFAPLGDEASRAALAVSRVGECGGRVLGALGPG